MYLTNICNKLVLPEIDNVKLLDNEEKNTLNLENIRDEITEVLLKKNKKEIIGMLKRILNSSQLNSDEILNKNEKWVNNLLIFSKFLDVKRKKIKNRNFFKYFELVKDGFLTKNINLTEIIAKSKLLLERAKRENSKNSNKYVWDQSAQADEALLLLLNKEFKNVGILKESSNFLGKKVKVRKATVILSTPEDTQFKLFLGDLDDYEEKYINYHIDPKGGILKAMVYLNDVDCNSGPFQVIKYSHNSFFDPIKYLFARSISTANYCDSPENRILINSLPQGLRSSLNFGRMLSKDTNITKIIDKDLETITSDKANTVLFIPDQVIHRGAICTSKSRLALQVQIF